MSEDQAGGIGDRLMNGTHGPGGYPYLVQQRYNKKQTTRKLWTSVLVPGPGRWMLLPQKAGPWAAGFFLMRCTKGTKRGRWARPAGRRHRSRSRALDEPGDRPAAGSGRAGNGRNRPSGRSSYPSATGREDEGRHWSTVADSESIPDRVRVPPSCRRRTPGSPSGRRTPISRTRLKSTLLMNDYFFSHT
jgi:hypothetical protein